MNGFSSFVNLDLSAGGVGQSIDSSSGMPPLDYLLSGFKVILAAGSKAENPCLLNAAGVSSCSKFLFSSSSH